MRHKATCGDGLLEPCRGYEGAINGEWDMEDFYDCMGTCAVGSYAAGAFGLVDMTGNVSEWVSDWDGFLPFGGITKNYSGPPKGPARVYRGGNWNASSGEFLIGTIRDAAGPAFCSASVGFRCAR